jgi:predicted Zn-dependent protease
MALRGSIADGFSHLEIQAKRAHSEGRRNLLLRSFNDLWAQGIEAGQEQLQQRHFEVAASYFQLMGEVSPHEPWPALLLAETRAAAGNKKEAIKSLREAIKRGLKNPEAIEKDSYLQGMGSDAEFQKIVAELKAK